MARTLRDDLRTEVVPALQTAAGIVSWIIVRSISNKVGDTSGAQALLIDVFELVLAVVVVHGAILVIRPRPNLSIRWFCVNSSADQLGTEIGESTYHTRRTAAGSVWLRAQLELRNPSLVARWIFKRLHGRWATVRVELQPAREVTTSIERSEGVGVDDLMSGSRGATVDLSELTTGEFCSFYLEVRSTQDAILGIRFTHTIEGVAGCRWWERRAISLHTSLEELRILG